MAGPNGYGLLFGESRSWRHGRHIKRLGRLRQRPGIRSDGQLISTLAGEEAGWSVDSGSIGFVIHFTRPQVIILRRVIVFSSGSFGIRRFLGPLIPPFSFARGPGAERSVYEKNASGAW